MRLLLVSLALLAAPALAQTAPPPTASDRPDHTTPYDPDPTGMSPAPTWTDAEQAVRATIAADGVHVVHLWAPWCGNSMNEFRSGLAEAVDAHPDVTFSFVTVWNDGDAGESTLQRFGLADRVARLADGDDGPNVDRASRSRTFLGLPVTWTPTTWVFNRNGKLATAFNYGEVTPDQLSAAIDGARASWTHD